LVEVAVGADRYGSVCTAVRDQPSRTERLLSSGAPAPTFGRSTWRRGQGRYHRVRSRSFEGQAANKSPVLTRQNQGCESAIRSLPETDAIIRLDGVELIVSEVSWTINKRPDRGMGRYGLSEDEGRNATCKP
jgi:hypothetical protein